VVTKVSVVVVDVVEARHLVMQWLLVQKQVQELEKARPKDLDWRRAA
jgi:hypothetical protein